MSTQVPVCFVASSSWRCGVTRDVACPRNGRSKPGALGILTTEVINHVLTCQYVITLVYDVVTVSRKYASISVCRE